ncbi:MAG: hypothetical protein WC756_16395 [Taibaiella sp.]|jgi:hypothetical protein
MKGENKYLLRTGAEMPHLGELLQKYITEHRVYQSALARIMGRVPKTIQYYKKNHSMQAAILWELSHALKHNFFADLAAALPDTFTRNSDSEPDAKEEQIATLQAENARLLQDKELLMRVMKEGK